MPLDYNYTGTEQTLSISEVDGLQTDLDLKADQTSISNMDNTSDANKPVSTAQQTALDLKADQTSISNMDNTSDANKPVSTAQQTALDLKADQTSISNMDNTSDANKPVSNATQTALNLKQNLLNTSDLFLDTSVAGKPKLGLGTATPSSTAGSDSFLQIYGATDCGISLKRGANDWEWKNINPSGNLCLYASGSHKAEWSPTELLLKQGLTVKGAVVDMEALPTSAQAGTTKLWNNSGAINIGAGASGGGGGVCLESIAVIPTGQSITTTSGQSLTFPNIVATTGMPAYPSFLNIGQFDYLPPTGTKMVILSYKLRLPYQGSFTQYLMFNCSENATEITHTQVAFENGGGESPCYTIEVVINIDSAFGSDDIANGKLASWTTPKTFIFQGQKKLPVYIGNIHGKYGYGGQNLTFAPPTMKIEAFS